MAKTNYYGSGAIMSAGFDLNSPAPLDYKTSVISWDPHTETVINDGVTEEVQVYDIDKIPLTAVRVGMIVSDQTEGIAKILKSIPDGITLAHECIWEEVGGTQTQSDWTQSDNTRPDYIKNKPTLSTVATSGSYADLSNKPTIPAAQVNSDWNASSGVAQILNKPNLATVATSGSYSDLDDTPEVTVAQVLEVLNDEEESE